VATQFSEIALNERWLAIEGRAILTADEEKGVRNELRMAIARTTFLVEVGAGLAG
jgi:hypothetical protein